MIPKKVAKFKVVFAASYLIICEVSYGHLEQLGDMADLYNKQKTKCNFNLNKSFQLPLRHLSLPKEDGLILQLHIPSHPPIKPHPQVLESLHLLHFFPIDPPSFTATNGLKNVRAPPDALCHLRDFHEQHGLGDIEYCIIWYECTAST